MEYELKMAKVKIKSKVKKVKRKFPVEIKAPETFNSISLGKSEVTDLAGFVGKSIKMNLMYVTKNVKNQNVRLTFKVSGVNSGVAKTEVINYEQIPYYLNRFVKAGSDLVEDSFTCVSKDGQIMRVKPFIITKDNTSIMISSALRDKTRELIAADAKTQTVGEYIANVTAGNVQKSLRNELKKIFPLKAFEFKKVTLE